MDSLTQVALGSAVGIAVMGRRTKIWKAALWGGVCGTLPDLDAFIDHGDPIRNMTFHRAETHALFYLTLAAPPLAWLIARLSRERQHFRSWWLAVWLILITHALLDLMTVYGTQIALPFTDYPFAIGSIFIIDPLYTLPLLIGLIAAFTAHRERGLRWNAGALVLSTLYLGWSLVAQQIVLGVARDSLMSDRIAVRRVEANPTAFNTLLWRVIALTDDGYVEGYYSLLDPEPRITFDHFARGNELYEQLKDKSWSVRRVAWFSHGFFKMVERDDRVLMSDVRMGMEPYYTFTFVVAQRGSELVPVERPTLVSPGRNVGPVLAWMRRRVWGEVLPPPR